MNILLDMDGVVVDFFGGAVELFPQLKTPEIRQALKNGKLLDDYVPKHEFWSEVAEKREGFWENLKPLPWAKDLMKLLESIGPVCFLTSPGNNEATPHAACGKIKWIRLHFKGIPFFIGKEKAFAAHKNALLIDDTEKNCINFRAFGGNAYLWPNQYKIIDWDIKLNDAFCDIQTLIGKIKDGK